MCRWSKSPRRQVGPAPCRRRWPGTSRNCDEIALVGAHGVRRRVLVQREMLEKVCRAAPSFGTPSPSRALDGTSGRRLHPARRESASARSRQRDVLRSAFFRGTRAAARLRLERRHDAERDVGRLVVFADRRATRSSASAPIAVVRGGARSARARAPAPRRCGRRSGPTPPTRRSPRRRTSARRRTDRRASASATSRAAPSGR